MQCKISAQDLAECPRTFDIRLKCAAAEQPAVLNYHTLHGTLRLAEQRRGVREWNGRQARSTSLPARKILGGRFGLLSVAAAFDR